MRGFSQRSRVPNSNRQSLRKSMGVCQESQKQVIQACMQNARNLQHPYQRPMDVLHLKVVCADTSCIHKRHLQSLGRDRIASRP